DDGSAGSSRDQRTRISPTLATYSRPFGRMAKPLRVSRIACRLSLRGLNFGGAILGPLRLPVTEAKKFRYALCRSLSDCTSTTLETSLSQARSGVFLASVMTCF